MSRDGGSRAGKKVREGEVVEFWFFLPPLFPTHSTAPPSSAVTVPALRPGSSGDGRGLIKRGTTRDYNRVQLIP
jgi:hypothetical protein